MKMFNQIDLFYRPDLSQETHFNSRIYYYEFRRLQMRLKQVQKQLEELEEDKQKLIKYKRLQNNRPAATISKTDSRAIKYLIKDAEEQYAEQSALLMIQQAAHENITYETRQEEEIKYIPSDIKLDIELQQKRTKCRKSH